MQSELKRLPLGIQTFENIIEGNYMYIDKTEQVYQLTHEFKYVFMSRPRRFGKSLLASTLEAYFEGRKELFKGLAIEQLEKDWHQHPVLLISMASAKGGTVEDFNERIGLQMRRLEEQFGLTEYSHLAPGTRLQKLIMHTGKNQKAVVIIDEYDAPLLTVLHKREKLEEMRVAVRSFFSCLKDCDRYLRFVFLTGVSKFSQLSIFSELNNLTKISMMPRYSTLCGITQQELETQLKPWVERLAERQEMTYEEALHALKHNYDGYHFAEDLTDVYNPYSLLSALEEGKISDYWFDTATPTFLIEMLKKFNTNIRQLEGSCARANDFDAPAENMKSVLPLFYQSGYLTIKDYSRLGNIYTLDIPNHEVRMGLFNSLEQGGYRIQHKDTHPQ